MQAKNDYTARVLKYLNEICPKDGYQVDSVTFTKENNEWFLRSFIYRTDGVDMTVNDCAQVSRKLSKWLDKEDFIPEQYMMEVCSLGFKDHPGDADIIPDSEDIDTAEAAADADNISEDITGRGKNK